MQTGSLTPWHMMSGYKTPISITDIKDDGSAVLFSVFKEGGNLFIRNVSDGSDKLVLSRPGSTVTGAWLSGEQQLLIHTISSDALSSQLWVYDPASTELQTVAMPLPDLFIGTWRLSHDRKWLAFLTRKYGDFQSNGLWIADLSGVR